MPKSQKEIHLERLRAIYEEFWPYRQIDRFQLTDNELVICEHFRREMEGMRVEMDRIVRKVNEPMTARNYA